ncbi:MAG: peptidase C11 [Lachnospiraceae bacterium]|nr:peptidase C11 [Lachnospiraceae bacterium]
MPREKHVTDGGKGVQKHGSGLGGGPVGRADGYSGRTGGSGGPQRDGSGGGGGGMMKIILLIVVLLLGGGGGGAALLSGGGGGDDSYTTQQSTYDSQPAQTQDAASQTVTPSQSSQQSSSSGQSSLSPAASSGSIFSMLTGMSSVNHATQGWQDGSSNTGNLNRTVDAAAREKRTVIKGNGTDTVTIMVYMCGTDLESKSSMASNDLAEMCNANLSDNVNIIVYTGGCKSWHTQGISAQTNQIYRVKKGGLERLVDDDGAKRMTDPNTLSSFIQFCNKNFPADRMDLIFWDHGGGSISGYGYDEKYASQGSMDLSGIDRALKNGGVTFDFIGFDACLMATLETALMLDPYADYLFASEETEPGIGWYYTNWLTELSANPSMETIEIGKNICDDFVTTCDLRCRGQKTTLSVIDLAELSRTVPAVFADFAKDTGEMIRTEDQYAEVSNARATTREFAVSSKIDQIDLVNFASNIGSNEAEALKAKLLSAVKYNRTSSNMTNAYGVSIYFPYQKTSKVRQAVSTYSAIGLGDEYSKCIQSFAGMQQAGQAAGGGAGSPLGSLMGLPSSSGSYSGGSQVSGSDAIGALLSAFMTGGREVPGMDADDASMMQDESLFDAQKASDYIAVNQFDQSALTWQEEDGMHLLSMPKENWQKVQTLLVNMFYDDGEGYIDLGLDDLYEFTEDGRLIGDTDNTWLSIDGQPVAFYYETTVEEEGKETITGRVPALLNGDKVNLILVFDDADPYGRIEGAVYDYDKGETDTVAKSMTELTEGDEIKFVCDYYSYDGKFVDNFLLGDPWSYHKDAQISNTDVQGKTVITYLLTDIYNREYWTPGITQN